MTKLIIKETSELTILKFEFEDFLLLKENFEFKNIKQKNPPAQQLFLFAFRKNSIHLKFYSN
jgi:hypothetical protein